MSKDKKYQIVERILSMIQNETVMSREIMAQELGVSSKTVGRYLKELKELNVIERAGSDKSGYWRIREN